MSASLHLANMELFLQEQKLTYSHKMLYLEYRLGSLQGCQVGEATVPETSADIMARLFSSGSWAALKQGLTDRRK